MKFSFHASGLLAVILLGSSIPSPVHAEATTPQIGRLNYAGYKTRGHCTVSLIGERTALTATHCIDKFPPKKIKIVLGYDRGDWKELHTVDKTWRHPTKDIAILCMKESSKLDPLPLATRWFSSKLVKASVQGYRRGRPHLQSRFDCVAQHGRKRIRLECPQEPGMSGSPVFAKNNAIIGVMSQSGTAFSLADPINDLPKNFCKR